MNIQRLAADAFYNLAQFASKPAAPPPAGEPNPRIVLRRKAEAHIQEKESHATEKLESLSPETLRTILHELRVHQIELEMQNEEMNRSQAELEASRRRYFDLYDLAPVGYITVSEAGMILEVNLTATTLLALSRPAMVRQQLSKFIFNEDQDIYYKHRRQLFDTGEPQQCELRMVKPDGTTVWTHLQSITAQDDAGAPTCRIVLSDITGRRKAE